MSLTINTKLLQDMVSRSVKGVGNSKGLVNGFSVSYLMYLELKKKTFTIITTDGVNFLYIMQDGVEGEDFCATINADIFSKLVSKMTSEQVTMSVTDRYLEVKGNGNYKIALELDPNTGAMTKYPNPLEKLKLGKKYISIESGTIGEIIGYLKPSLALTVDNPCYTGYYVGHEVLATDSMQIACIDREVFKDPKLISPELMNLLYLMDNSDIDVYVKDGHLVFKTDTCVVYGDAMSDEMLESFAHDKIVELLNMKFTSRCVLPKDTLLRLFERLSLFVGVYDENAVDLAFDKSGVAIASKNSDGTEYIEYAESENCEEYACTVDIQMLQAQIKSHSGDTVELWFGANNALMITDGDVKQVVGTMK